MSQIQGPPPTLISAEPLNNGLFVTWDVSLNDPYVETATDATLLVINTVTNVMTSILLTHMEIIEGEYTVTGLTNGEEYALLFSELDPSGNTHNSNTITGTPADVPAVPTIINYALQSPLFNSVVVNATLGVNNGSPITKLVFRILRERYTDLSGNSVAPVVTTQAFNIDISNNYTLTDFVIRRDYVISCQALNSVGYSNVSNSKSFNNSDAPRNPILGTIQSGSNAFALLPVSGTNTSLANITQFNVYNSGIFLRSFSGYDISTNYTVDLSLNSLTNGQAYNLTVTAENTTGESQNSNISTVVPALKLAYSNILLTFPDASSVQVVFDTNNATFLTSGRTRVDFSGNNIPPDAFVDVSNNLGFSTLIYHLPSGTLVTGSTYTVTINGYCLIPSNLYPAYWTSPTLSNYQYSAVPLSVSSFYSTVPGPVTNITHLTDIIDGSGQIQFKWNDASNNGAPILDYTAQLYTVTALSRAPTTGVAPIVTSNNNCLFTSLNTNLSYAVGITARNLNGSGPAAFDPSGTNIYGPGFSINDSINSVINLSGTQTTLDSSGVFVGKLNWNYPFGPGSGYANTSFSIYSVNGNQETFIGSTTYSAQDPSNTVYQFSPINLGTVPNVSKQFVVYAVANTISIPSTNVTSIGVYQNITTGLAPIISDVTISTYDPSNSIIRFRVTNNTNKSMIQGSISTTVLPYPTSELVPGLGVIYNGYTASNVDITGSAVFEHILGYTALGVGQTTQYWSVTASNGYGTDIEYSGWT